eukprot:8500635-Lingulodinium_polyedra.AAC.1
MARRTRGRARACGLRVYESDSSLPVRVLGPVCHFYMCMPRVVVAAAGFVAKAQVWRGATVCPQCVRRVP